MDSPIHARFRFTRDEFLASVAAQKHISPIARRLQLVFAILGVIAVVSGVVIVAKSGWRPDGIIPLALGLGLLMSPFSTRRILLKTYAAQSDADKVRNWEFHPDRVILTTAGTTATSEWRMFSRVVRTPGGFLLYPNDRMANWLPFHAFGSEADKEAFAQLAKSKVQNYAEAARGVQRPPSPTTRPTG
jgi:hypothetical protein